MTTVEYSRNQTEARITATGHQKRPDMCAGISVVMCAIVNGLDDADVIDFKITDGLCDVRMKRSVRADAMYDMTVRAFKAMRDVYGDELRTIKMQ